MIEDDGFTTDTDPAPAAVTPEVTHLLLDVDAALVKLIRTFLVHPHDHEWLVLPIAGVLRTFLTPDVALDIHDDRIRDPEPAREYPQGFFVKVAGSEAGSGDLWGAGVDYTNGTTFIRKIALPELGHRPAARNEVKFITQDALIAWF